MKSIKTQYMQKQLLFGAILFSIICYGCHDKKQKQTTSSTHADRLVGSWEYSEVENGVRCVVEFHPDHRLSQHFTREDGTGKTRPGEWIIKGDSLYIDEKVGASTLLIKELNDSSMTLLTTDNIPVYFFRVKK